MLIPASLKVAEGIRALVLDQFVSWKQARDGQGVKPGEKALPRKSHPDIAKQFNELDMATQHWMIGLVTLGRVTVLKALSADDKQILLEVGRSNIELDKSLQTRVAEMFHDGWWTWRRMNGQSGHIGDVAWQEQDEAAQENDMVLVPVFATLFAQYADSDDEAQLALASFILE